MSKTLQQVREENPFIFNGFSDDDVFNYIHETSYSDIPRTELAKAVGYEFPDKPWTEDAKEAGRQFIGGTVVDLPHAYGQAIKAVSPDGSFMDDVGKGIVDRADKRAPDYEPDTEGQGLLAHYTAQAARSAPLSLATMAPYAIPVVGPALGAAATGFMFGGSSYQDTLEKGKQQGLSDQEAHNLALKTAGLNAGGELIGNQFSLKMLGAGKDIVGNTMGKLIGEATDDGIIKPAAKVYGEGLIGENFTELGQNLGQEALQRDAGLKKEGDYGDIAKESLGTTTALTTGFSLLGLPAHVAQSNRAQNLKLALESADTPDEIRLNAVNSLHQIAKENKVDDADNWLKGALNDIANKLPIRTTSQADTGDIGNAQSTDQAINTFSHALNDVNPDNQLNLTGNGSVDETIANVSKSLEDNLLNLPTLKTNTGFGKLSEFENFKDDLIKEQQQALTDLANRQQLERESRTETLNNTLGTLPARESQNKRLDILNAGLENPDIQNKADWFKSELARQGYRNTDLTDFEANHLNTFNNLLDQQSVGQNTAELNSAPDEHHDLGIEVENKNNDSTEDATQIRVAHKNLNPDGSQRIGTFLGASEKGNRIKVKWDNGTITSTKLSDLSELNPADAVTSTLPEIQNGQKSQETDAQTKQKGLLEELSPEQSGDFQPTHILPNGVIGEHIGNGIYKDAQGNYHPGDEQTAQPLSTHGTNLTIPAGTEQSNGLSDTETGATDQSAIKPSAGIGEKQASINTETQPEAQNNQGELVNVNQINQEPRSVSKADTETGQTDISSDRTDKIQPSDQTEETLSSEQIPDNAKPIQSPTGRQSFYAEQTGTPLPVLRVESDNKNEERQGTGKSTQVTPIEIHGVTYYATEQKMPGVKGTHYALFDAYDKPVTEVVEPKGTAYPIRNNQKAFYQFKNHLIALSKAGVEFKDSYYDAQQNNATQADQDTTTTEPVTPGTGQNTTGTDTTNQQTTTTNEQVKETSKANAPDQVEPADSYKGYNITPTDNGWYRGEKNNRILIKPDREGLTKAIDLFEPKTPDIQAEDKNVFIPTHELNDGTPVKHVEGNIYKDSEDTEWQADDATPITQQQNNANTAHNNSQSNIDGNRGNGGNTRGTLPIQNEGSLPDTNSQQENIETSGRPIQQAPIQNDNSNKAGQTSNENKVTDFISKNTGKVWIGSEKSANKILNSDEYPEVTPDTHKIVKADKTRFKIVPKDIANDQENQATENSPVVLDTGTITGRNEEATNPGSERSEVSLPEEASQDNGRRLIGSDQSNDIANVIDSEVKSHKQKYLRLHREAKSNKNDVSLEDKLLLQQKAKEQEQILRQARLNVFKAEDLANKSVETNDISHFEPIKNIFPKTYQKLQSDLSAKEQSTVIASNNNRQSHQPKELSNDEAEYLIKIAADSVSKLRKQDVHRVLNSAPKESVDSLGDYVKTQRPDLHDEVNDVLGDIKTESQQNDSAQQDNQTKDTESVDDVKLDSQQDNSTYTEPSLDELKANLRDVENEIASQGRIINAVTRRHRDQLRDQIAEKEHPEIFKALYGDAKATDTVALTVELNKDIDLNSTDGQQELKKKVKERLANHGWSGEYSEKGAENVVKALTDKQQNQTETKQAENDLQNSDSINANQSTSKAASNPSIRDIQRNISKEQLAAAQAEAEEALRELGAIFLDANLFAPKAVPVKLDNARLLPVLSRLTGAYIKMGYIHFKDNARAVMAVIREKFGDAAADSLSMANLRAAYNNTEQGATPEEEVITYKTFDQLYDNVDKTNKADQGENNYETNKPSDSDKERTKGTEGLDSEGTNKIRSGRGRTLANNGKHDDAEGNGSVLAGVQTKDVQETGANADDLATGTRSGVQDAGSERQIPKERDSMAGLPVSGQRGVVDNGSRGKIEDKSGKKARKDKEEIDGAEQTKLGNYHLDDPDSIIGGTPSVRFARNKKAIETLTSITEENKQPTEEERNALAAYIGWGSFGQELFQGSWEHPVFRDGWKEQNEWLRDHLGEKAWKSAQSSIINAHYTDPPTVKAIWDMAKKLGFNGGRILEPSMGIGNFFGLMPKDIMERSQLTGIELDETTGNMAKILYPDANIQVKGYQDSKTSDGFYDLVIGNWPFAKQSPSDRRYNKLNLSLHDYFFVKGLDQLRDGGIMIGITSSGTMDKVGKLARHAIDQKAVVLGAFRMPMGAFDKYAGTSVVADIIILQKRGSDVKETGNDIINVSPMLDGNGNQIKRMDGTSVNVNDYWTANPDNVLGTMKVGRGTTFGRDGMIVDRPENYASILSSLADRLPSEVMTERKLGKHISYISNNTADRQNSIVINNGELYVVQGDHLAKLSDLAKYELKKKQDTEKRIDQFKRLISIRSLYGKLIDDEIKGESDTEKVRQSLNKAYQDFINEHGKINESFALRIFNKVNDPLYPALAALEVNTGTHEKPFYSPSAILTKSTIRKNRTISNPSIADAFVVVRNENAQFINIDRIAELSNTTVQDVSDKLLDSGALFKTPSGNYEVSDIYLAGNVRLKLREALDAQELGQDMTKNIEALKKVIPKDIPYFSIEASLGANWISAKHYQQFIADLLNISEEKIGDIKATLMPKGWRIELQHWINNKEEAKTIWGVSYYPFSRIINSAFSGAPITIKSRDADGTEYVDEPRTKEANEKADKLREEFKNWVWKSPERRIDLEKAYNEVLNAFASPSFDGSFMSFNGLSLQRGDSQFNLRQHQVNAIWRGVANGRGLYAHEVGTGKTYTMGGIAIESRKYGVAKKPVIFAHNANSASVANDIQSMYPAANVLYINNLSPSDIKQKMYQIAHDDWDVVVVPHSLLPKFALTRETLMNIAQKDIIALEEEAIASAQEEGFDISDVMNDEEALRKIRGATTAKQLVKQRNAIIESINKQAERASKEDAIPFEKLGIDMIIIDEAHEFKKPPLTTKMRVKGLNTNPSAEGIAMHLLSTYIRDMNNGKGVHIFTGTPITNTLNEIYNQMRYVMGDSMEDAGVLEWDSWFNTFAGLVSDVELTSTGEYEAITRLSGFHNVAELRRFAGQYMDIVFADDMPEFEPRKTQSGKTLHDNTISEQEKEELLTGRNENPYGRPYKKIINDTAPVTDDQKRILNDLIRLARMFKNADRKTRRELSNSGHPSSPLLVETNAAKASFDPRLYEIGLPDNPGYKVNRAIKNVMNHYHEHPKSTQVIFMEKGFNDYATRIKTASDGSKVTTRHETFNVAKDIVEKLIKEGIPKEQIAVVTGSTSKEKRKEIADAMNKAEIRVVIGSTSTLGVGVNMQDNLRAMHHLDAPWMPGDLEQRNGRGHRQGNKWNTVLEYRYLTEGLDGRRWQVLAIKQKFITNFLKANDDIRTIEGDATDMAEKEDIDDISSSLSSAAGDPRLLIKEKLKGDVNKLENKQRSHDYGIQDAKYSIERLTKENKQIENDIKRISSDIEHLQSVKNDDFSITILGKNYDNREQANEKLQSAFNYSKVRDEIGEFKGFKIIKYYSTVELNRESKLDAQATIGSIEANLRNLPKRIDKLKENIEENKQAIISLDNASKTPFSQESALNKKKELLKQLEEDIENYPVAAPSWLRSGSPVGTDVFVNGDKVTVQGHRWGHEDWFVLVDKDGKTEAIPYRDIKDENNIPVYEEIDFEPPHIIENEQKGDIQSNTKTESSSLSTPKGIKVNDSVIMDDDSVANVKNVIKPAKDIGRESDWQLEVERENGDIEIVNADSVRKEKEGLVKTNKDPASNNTDTKFSRTSSAPQNTHSQPSLLSSIRSALDGKFYKGWTDAVLGTGKVELISRKDADAIIDGKDDVDVKYSKNGDVIAFYDPRTDKSYFVYDNISKDTTPGELQGLVAHEVAVHQLNLLRNDQEFKDLLSQVERMYLSGNKFIYKGVDRTLSAFRINTPPSIRMAQGVNTNAIKDSDILTAKSFIKKLSDDIFAIAGSGIRRNVDPGLNEHSLNITRTASDNLADFFQSRPVFFHSNGSINVETLDHMLSLMISGSHDSEIIKSIISFAPIDMVDMLIGGKASSKMLLHDKSMFIDLNAIDINNPVSLKIYVATRIALAISEFNSAGLGTKLSSTVFDSGNVGVKNSTAKFTRNINSSSGLGISKDIRTGYAAKGFTVSDLNSAFDTIIDRHNDDILNSRSINDNIRNIVSPELFWEEVISYAIEQNPNHSISQRFVALVRKALRAIGNTLPFMQKNKWIKWANSLSEGDIIAMANSALRQASTALMFDNVGKENDTIRLAQEKGYKGNDASESKEWLSAVAKGLDMSKEARMQRAKYMGFDVDKVWYHGGFSNFDAFDPKKSGSGTFNFASNRDFAESYAQTKSQDEEGDYSIIVRPFLLPKKLFDFNNKDHLKQLENILPEKIKITSNYGWAAFGGAKEYSKDELIEAIQGISLPYTGLDNNTKDKIRNGGKYYKRDGGTEYAINYDKETDTVEYAPSWQVESINSIKSQIEWMEKEQPGYFQIPLKKLELKRAEEKLKTYKLKLNPDKKNGYDNWSILESEEIRPYIRELGFEGSLMQERKKETASIFDVNRIRSINAAFDPDFKDSPNLLASAPQQRFYSALSKAFRDAPEKIFGKGPQVKMWLNANAAKFDVKKDEVYWSGISDWLDMQGKVSKDDVLNFLDQNGVKVEDVVLGDRSIEPAIQQWLDDTYANVRHEDNADEDGGGYIAHYADGDIGEVFDSEEEAWAALREEAISQVEEYQSIDLNLPKHNTDQLTLPNGSDYRELVLTIPTTEKYREYDDTHFGDVGEGKQIAWIRYNTRTDPDGKQTLFLEEVQSQRGASYRTAKSNINKDIDMDFLGIVERMRQSGVLEVNCG